MNQRWFGLNQKFNQPSLKPYVRPSLMLYPSMFVQCVGGRSRMCVYYVREISPTLIFVPVLLENKRNKQGLYRYDCRGAKNLFIYCYY